MVDSEYSPDNSNTLKISIGAIRKNLEMPRFVSDHVKMKKIFKIAVKMSPFAILNVPDQ